jgi:carbon storage regulator
MLVLSRKIGEKVLMSQGDIEVTVLAVNGNKVGLGISAPAEITVHREEVWLQICRQTVISSAKQQR